MEHPTYTVVWGQIAPTANSGFYVAQAPKHWGEERRIPLVTLTLSQDGLTHCVIPPYNGW